MKYIFLIATVFLLSACGESRPISTADYNAADNYYRQCLMEEGFSQDDYCEDKCTRVYYYAVCDAVEDYYEEKYGIGTDRFNTAAYGAAYGVGYMSSKGYKKYQSTYRNKSSASTSSYQPKSSAKSYSVPTKSTSTYSASKNKSSYSSSKSKSTSSSKSYNKSSSKSSYSKSKSKSSSKSSKSR